MVIMMATRPEGLIPSKRRKRELHTSGEAAVHMSESFSDVQRDVGHVDGPRP